MKNFKRILVILFCVSILTGTAVNAGFSSEYSRNDVNTPTTATVYSLSRNQVKDFVTRLYNKVLGRNPDAGGLEYWINNIMNGKITVKNVSTNGFFNSKEFKNKKLSNDKFVRILYNTFLDRNYDTDGYNYWMKHLQKGTSRDTIISGFANSQEFTKLMNKYGVNSKNVENLLSSEKNTEGPAGKVAIYRGNTVVYEMALATSKNGNQWQKIVDNKSTALIADFLGKKMLADHAADGLKAMKNCQVGDKLVITKDGKTTVYRMTKMDKNAINNGKGIITNGKYADELNYGELFAYCCNDAYGKSVTLTFWKKQ